METLISMTDFVLEQLSIKQSTSEFKEIVKNYANFLKQPLKLEMFVPCDKDGDVIPDKENHFTRKELQEYQEARERCLFKGFEIFEMDEDNFIYITFLFNENNCKLIFDKESNSFLIDTPVFDEYVEKIEDLVKYNLELTKTAQEQIGL